MSQTNPNSTDLISVIIRSIDRDTLAHALSSIAYQTYPLIEIVIVNAKGPDHRPVPTSLDNRSVLFIDSTTPLPRSLAANVGLEHAHGYWLMFLDDDDYLAPTHMEGLIQTVIQTQTKAAYSHCQVVDWLGNKLPRQFIESYNRTKLMAGNFLPIHTVLFARSLYELGCRFDESLDRFEDWDFWLQVANYTDFIELPALTAFYRVYAGAGFGVTAPQQETQEHVLKLAAKWRDRITPQDFLALMDMARHHRYLERYQCLINTIAKSIEQVKQIE